jgi:hypothetical protein
MSHVDDDDDLVDLDENPAPRTPVFTVILCVLNLAAVLAVGFLLLKDIAARNHWAYIVFQHDLAIQGLPLEEEENRPSDTPLTARLTLEPRWLQEAYKQRERSAKPFPENEQFRQVEFNPQPIRPSELREPNGTPKKVLEEAFKEAGKPVVATLDQEIQNLEKTLPETIQAAVAGAGKGLAKDEDKRNLLRSYLLPLVHLREDSAEAAKGAKAAKDDDAEEDPKAPRSPKEVKWREVVDPILQLNWAIESTSGEALDKLIVDAARRKMLVDILKRLEAFRPYNPDETLALLNQAAAVYAVEEGEPVAGKKPAKDKVALTPARYKVKTEDLADLLAKRVKETIADKNWEGQSRHGLEKRRSVAFLLYTLSRMRKTGPFTINGVVLGEVRDLGLPIPPKAQETLKDLLGKSFESPAELNKALLESKFLQELEKALPGEGPRYLAALYDRAREPLYSPARAEVISGVREFTRAAETTALVVDRFQEEEKRAIQLDRGDGRYSLDYHVHDPKLLATRLLRLLKRMNVAVPNPKTPRAATEKLFTDHLTDPKLDKLAADEKEAGNVKVLRAVKGLLDKQGIKVANPKDPDAKLKEAEFDLAVLRLTDTRSPGYLVRHHELVTLIRDLAARVREKEKRLTELKAQKEALDVEYKKTREPYRADVAKEVVALRAKTRALADDVLRYTQEIFRAQVELADADRYNQALEREIRRLEQLPRNRKKRAK